MQQRKSTFSILFYIKRKKLLKTVTHRYICASLLMAGSLKRPSKEE